MDVRDAPEGPPDPSLVIMSGSIGENDVSASNLAGNSVKLPCHPDGHKITNRHSDNDEVG